MDLMTSINTRIEQGQPTRPAAITVNLAATREALDRQGALLAQLRDRLDLVMRPSDPGESAKSLHQDGSRLSPLGKELEELTAQVSDRNLLIERLIDGLDLP